MIQATPLYLYADVGDCAIEPCREQRIFSVPRVLSGALKRYTKQPLRRKRVGWQRLETKVGQGFLGVTNAVREKCVDAMQGLLARAAFHKD